MSIRPVDFQIMVPRSMDASKNSSNEVQRYVSVHQQQMAATQNKAEEFTKIVYSQEQAQGVRISQKQNDNRGNNRKYKRKNENRDKDDSPDDRPRVNTIDIKI